MRTLNGTFIGLVLVTAIAVTLTVFGQAVPAPQAAAPSAAAQTAAPEPGSQNAAIHQQVRTDIQNLRSEARAQIRALLTEPQQAQFDTLGVLNGQAGQHSMKKGFGGAGGAGQCSSGGGAQTDMGQRFLDHLSQQLSLTDAQRASIQTILDNTHSAMTTRRDKAHADFRAILTPEQTATLDQLKALRDEQPGQRGPGRMGGWRSHKDGAEAAGNGPLQLTADQKTQAKAIFTQLRTDVKQMHADARQQIAAQLTDQQKAQFDALHPAAKFAAGEEGPDAAQSADNAAPGAKTGQRGEGMHARAWRGREWSRGGGGDGALLERLTTTLNLTDAQRGSVQSILDNLHSAVRARIQQAHADAGGGAMAPDQTTPADEAGSTR